MARWTRSAEERNHVSRIGGEVTQASIVMLTLKNGQRIEGAVRRFQSGNNAGIGGWQYYGEVEIEGPEARYTIDFLDIDRVDNVWEMRKDEYEKAGIIEIVDYPQS
ncbi:hypothetical protein NOJ05_13645 [Neorhizobium galegae]|uniref:hypothetical protein n=1 Tax=Neorhizobium galegae TaxID=399 RepID=UPI0021084AA5|nr:hypothetical protein [Neorhizobium galegae]MCQ1778246.1 hypothetical protein [Neorhizobium galegae]MCQ1796780.1 hypothetical protein [Neorhizobium galegae]